MSLPFVVWKGQNLTIAPMFNYAMLIFWGRVVKQQDTICMFCLWKTLKTYMQKPMCPWEDPNSKLVTACQKYGPELLCWGNIWLHRLTNVGQLAFSFKASFSTAFLDSVLSHQWSRRDRQTTSSKTGSERTRIHSPVLRSAMSQWKTWTLLILGMSLFWVCGREEGAMKTAIFGQIC